MDAQTAGPPVSFTEENARRPEIGSGLYAGQFLLGPRKPEGLYGWQSYPLAVDLHLTAHPSLTITRVTHGAKSLTSIGVLLDPSAPDADDREILEALFERFTSLDALIESTVRLGGRWAIVAVGDGQRHLFNDALGLRQAFHTPEGAPSRWALSQPGLAIALDLFQLTPDRAALDFLDSYEFRSHLEYRWPASASPFNELKRLLPNHVLDLSNGAVRRYWPCARLEQKEPERVVDEVRHLLEGQVRAAQRRFDLLVAVTAGIDSRLVLAACRDLRERVGFVTVRQSRMADDNPDLHVPARLLSQLGLKHDIVRAPVSMSPDFSRTFKRNAFMAHDHYGADAEAILSRFQRRKAVITGSGAEIGRCSFRSDLPFAEWRRITPSHLARLQRMGNQGFALQHFAAWLSESRERRNVKLLDLFEWEQGHGSWLAATQLEFDIAWREIITPYNCRALLLALLSVPERFRQAPNYTLFRMLIKELWPEVLCEPINPGQSHGALVHTLATLGRQLVRGFAARGTVAIALDATRKGATRS